jgi:hypothetical protein
MFVGGAASQSGRILGAGIPILRLDEHERQRRTAVGRHVEVEVASVVRPAPLVADAVHRLRRTPVEVGAEPLDRRGGGRLGLLGGETGKVCLSDGHGQSLAKTLPPARREAYGSANNC